MSTTVKAPLVCRSTTRKLLTAGLLAGLVAVLSGLPAAAGSTADPEIADVAGDGNFINGQGAQQGQHAGPDTRPVSFDNADLRAVWFETAYSTTKVRDASGNVQRVEYTPTALKVNIQTQGPVRPLSPWTYLEFKVPVTLVDCRASLELAALATSDRVEIKPIGSPCDPDRSLARSPATPTYQGAVATFTFPLTDAPGSSYFISPYLADGTVLGQPSAHVLGRLPVGSQANVQTDETAVGRNFTIGQDVPADINCSASPGHADCAS